MMPEWNWLLLGGFGGLVVYQWIRMYLTHTESKKQEELFQIITENAADMIALVDLKGNRLYNSPAYKRLLGYSAAELNETSSFEQIHLDDRFKVLEAAREARATGVGRQLEYRIRHKDGTWRVLESIARAIRDEKGDVTKLVIVNRDVTERKRAQEHLEHNSFHDALTGLPNRRLFLDRSQHLFNRVQRNPDRQYAVLFVDLDGFKNFNDNLGPILADQVIVEIGQRLRSCLRHDDTIARGQDELDPGEAILSRMGGDEFTTLLEGLKDPSDGMRVAKRMISAVNAPFLLNGVEVHTSASVGIALSTPAHKRAEDLLRDADVAMRRAKAAGGNRCELFDESMHTRAVDRLKLEDELRAAREKNEFCLLYQPIVDLQTSQFIGFEALLRWRHPERGLMAPDKFVAAGDAAVLLSMGQWLLIQSCQQLHAWDMENPGREKVGISVHISDKHFSDDRFVANLQIALRETGIEPSRLRVEITETAAAADPKLTAAVFSELKKCRVTIALNNFEGSSSLCGLRTFQVQAVKIAPCLINGMLLDLAVLDSIELIILLAHKLKLKVIAEGIDSAKQIDHLRELGCDMGQGSFFSQPVESDAAGQLLRSRNTIAHAKTAGS